MHFWFVISLAALVTCTLRSLPLVYAKFGTLPNFHMTQFLNYAVCAVIGSIIFEVGFDSPEGFTLDIAFWVKLITLVFSFVCMVKTKRVLLSFFLAWLGVYQFLEVLHYVI